MLAAFPLSNFLDSIVRPRQIGAEHGGGGEEVDFKVVDYGKPSCMPPTVRPREDGGLATDKELMTEWRSRPLKRAEE